MIGGIVQRDMEVQDEDDEIREIIRIEKPTSTICSLLITMFIIAIKSERILLIMTETACVDCRYLSISSL